jgi:hypothetical protein
MLRTYCSPEFDHNLLAMRGGETRPFRCSAVYAFGSGGQPCSFMLFLSCSETVTHSTCTFSLSSRECKLSECE